MSEEAKKAEEEQTQAANEQEADVQNDSEVNLDEAVSEDGSSETIAQLEAKLAEQLDLTLRIRAELENVRRRAQEDVEAAHKYAINKFITAILPVKDNLEMALMDTSGQFDNLKFGVELTLKEFQSAFNSAHIEELDPVGALLDPHYHQAMQTEESEDVAPNTILKVLKKGYKISDRLLRPALVVVATEKSKTE